MKTRLWVVGLFLMGSAMAHAQEAEHSERTEGPGHFAEAPSEPAIATALTAYNALPMGLSPLRLAYQGEYAGSATLPGWLIGTPLTRQEAAAVVALQSAYRLDPVINNPGSTTTYPGRKPHLLEYVAGAAVAVKANDDSNVRAGLSDGTIGPVSGRGSSTRVQPASYYSQDALYAHLLGQLGGCRGALTSALRKMTQSQPNERFVTDLGLLVSANAALNVRPDPSCRRGI